MLACYREVEGGRAIPHQELGYPSLGELVAAWFPLVWSSGRVVVVPRLSPRVEHLVGGRHSQAWGSSRPQVEGWVASLALVSAARVVDTLLGSGEVGEEARRVKVLETKAEILQDGAVLAEVGLLEEGGTIHLEEDREALLVRKVDLLEERVRVLKEMTCLLEKRTNILEELQLPVNLTTMVDELLETEITSSKHKVQAIFNMSLNPH